MNSIHNIIIQTPIEWYCKKQAIVVTAMSSYEFVTAQSKTDQIIDLSCEFVTAQSMTDLM